MKIISLIILTTCVLQGCASSCRIDEHYFNKDFDENSFVLHLDYAPERSDYKQAVVYWTEAWESPRPVRFHYLRLDLHQDNFEIVTLLSDDPDGEGPAEAELVSPIRLASDSNVIAAINANAFWHLKGSNIWERLKGWYYGKKVNIVGLAASNGERRSEPENTVTSFWTSSSGAFHFYNPDKTSDVDQGISSWFDTLLVNGEIVTERDNILHPRTFIGIDKNQRYMLFVVADGRQDDYSEGISLYEAAAVMKRHGYYNSINMDGGGSSIMLAQKGKKLTVMNKPPGCYRPIPVMLGIREKVKIKG